MRVEFAQARVRITVTDAGGAPGAGAGAGRGLLGLRERLAVYGGSLAAGPHDGGFRVDARIPA